jgi:hypothetical protein
MIVANAATLAEDKPMIPVSIVEAVSSFETKKTIYAE